MDLSIEYLGKAVAAPAAIALLLFVALRKTLPRDLALRYAGPVAFGAAMIAGCLLTGSVTFVPDRHWHWLPYLAFGASLIGGIAACESLRWFERAVLWLLASLVAAWLVVPDWASLSPSRGIWIIALVAGLAVLTASGEFLSVKVPAPTFLWSLILAATCVAGLIVGFVSLTFGKIAIIPAAALGGCLLGAMIDRTPTVRGLGLSYAVVIGGWAFVGTVEPQRPVLFLLIAALAPLALWCCVFGPVSRLRGWYALLAQTGVVAIVLTIAVAGMVVTVGLP
ncbi:MAG: hypothetical protein M3552_03850 [Planctomycetota bacterium]|nr:hypothetical protein [Planctomycetaceae bacterium]MDQ3329775.1 hypothetical protein [Planctomycetota bacterium]